MADDWQVVLEQGSVDAAWDLFIGRYRRLVFAAIRHYVGDHDDVMDAFAHVCEALREDGCRRLRAYVVESTRQAAFSTWLVTVVRRLTIDFLRRREGRRRPVAVEGLTELQRDIFELVFVERCSHLEAYGVICGRRPPGPSYRAFLSALRATHEAAARQRIRVERATPAPVLVVEDATVDVERRERVAWLDRALASLSAEDRVAVELYVVENLRAADIARILGLPNAKAAYNRVYRALDAIRSWLRAAGIGGSDL